MGLPCHKNCDYKSPIPGDAHISCQFDWRKCTREQMDKFPTCQSEYGQQWFLYPINFDPIWGPDECPVYSTEADSEYVDARDFMSRLIEALSGGI